MIQATDYSGNAERCLKYRRIYPCEVNLIAPDDSSFFFVTGEDISNQAEVTFTWEVNDEVIHEG